MNGTQSAHRIDTAYARAADAKPHFPAEIYAYPAAARRGNTHDVFRAAEQRRNRLGYPTGPVAEPSEPLDLVAAALFGFLLAFISCAAAYQF